MVTSVEGAEDSKELAAADLDALGLTADDTVVGVSASGRTPYAVGAVEHARALRRADRRPVLQRATARSPRPPTTASRSSSGPNCSPARPG